MTELNMSIRQAQSIVGYSPGRQENDFYPTPPEATEALLKVEKFPNVVWEPACGNGAISEILKDHKYLVFSSDLYSYGYDSESGINFLDSFNQLPKSIVTNPPFNLANKFVLHASELMTWGNISKFAFLCKLAFLEGQERSVILEETRLTRVHVFRKRIQMTRNGETPRGGGMIAFAWFVWERGYTGKPEVDWI